MLQAKPDASTEWTTQVLNSLAFFSAGGGNLPIYAANEASFVWLTNIIKLKNLKHLLVTKIILSQREFCLNTFYKIIFSNISYKTILSYAFYRTILSNTLNKTNLFFTEQVIFSFSSRKFKMFLSCAFYKTILSCIF